MVIFLTDFKYAIIEQGPIRNVESKDMKSTEEKESCGIYIKLYSDMECAELSLAPLTNRTPVKPMGWG